MDWFVLGIAPTKDKAAITAAYRQKLRQTNPEDKPEEFKALRAAYEEAMALADREEEARDESPVGLWMAEVEALYQDYPGRIDPNRWEELLRRDICMGLDSRGAAEEALMRFLMENYCLPRQVWLVLNQAFSFTERVEELYEHYPREFIDYAVLKGMRLEPALPYDLFVPGQNGQDCDTYRRLFSQAIQLPPAEALEVLAHTDALSERHPMGDMLRYRCQLGTDQEEAAKAGIRSLAQAYPDHSQLTMVWAEICLADGNTEAAQAIAERILEKEAEHGPAKYIIAQCLAARGMFCEAKEMLYDLMRVSDPLAASQYAKQMQQWNENIIAQRLQQWEAHPEDAKNAIELAWCYIQNEQLDAAVDVAVEIDESQADPFDYHNLFGKLNHNQQNFREALPHLQQLETIIRSMTPDGTQETEKRMRRLPEMIQLQGSCLMQLEQYEAARERFEAALELAPEDPEVLTMMGRILFTTGDYTYAVEILQRLIRIAPEAWHGDMLLALALYKLNRDPEAFEAINRALSNQGHDLSLYVVKMQILVRNGVWEEVHNILEFLAQNNAPEDIAVDYIKTQLAELEQNDLKQAFRQYQAIARRVEAGEDMLWASALYCRMAKLMSKGMNIQKEEDRELLIAQLDKGLMHDAQDADCLDFKAQLLQESGKMEEAIAMYRAVEAKNPRAENVQNGLAQLYYDNLALYAKEALSYYEQLLENRKTAGNYFYAATCKRYLGDLEGARKYYLLELEVDPDDVDAYRGLALLSDMQADYEKSLELLEQAIAIMDSYQREYMWLVEGKVQVLRRMGQYDRALAFVDEAMHRYHFDEGFQTKFDICCQFGLWDRAKQVLEDWKKARRNDPDQLEAVGKLHLYMGKMFKATWAMGTAKHSMSARQVEDFRLQLADLECNHVRKIEIWTGRVRENPGDDYALTNLAQALWQAGRKDVAADVARKALARLDEILTQNLTDEALFRCRRVLPLAILGREAEAREELTKVRKLPLCHFCAYGSCKDADIYEALLEEILENKEKALALYREGKKNWPDDLDFTSGEARLTRKGK